MRASMVATIRMSICGKRQSYFPPGDDKHALPISERWKDMSFIWLPGKSLAIHFRSRRAKTSDSENNGGQGRGSETKSPKTAIVKADESFSSTAERGHPA